MTPHNPADTQRKKKRRTKEGPTGSSPHVQTEVSEHEEKEEEFHFTTPAKRVRKNREEEEERDGETRDRGKRRQMKPDETAENSPKKKKKKKKKEKKEKKGDKHDVEKREKKKRRDRDTCGEEKKRRRERRSDKGVEDQSVSQDVMEEEHLEEEHLEEGAAPHERLEEDEHRDQRIDELQQFIPDVRSRSSDNINKMLRYDLQRFKAFRHQGVSLRWGRFSHTENQQIQQNVLDFLSLTGISTADQLMFPERFGEREDEIKQLKVKHHFLTRIAEGIPRPCQQVYSRAVKMFDERNHMGRFSEEELNSLMKLQTLHGNNWRIISKTMGRSAYSLEKRFSHISVNRGSWSLEETSKLLQAVKVHLETRVQQSPAERALSREQLCNNLPWSDISFQVGSRSWSQCRLKWFSVLKMKLSIRGSRFTTTADILKFKIHLINTMYNMNVDDLADINWDDITEAVGNSTSVCVQKAFHRLKTSKVPNWTMLSYGEIIDFLQLEVVPRLKDKLKTLSSEELQSETPQGGVYRLSEIFSETEDDFTEVDNSIS